MGIKNFIKNLQKVDNAEKKISTKGFLIFSAGMIFVIITLVVVLSLI
jgi:hypothetical protein